MAAAIMPIITKLVNMHHPSIGDRYDDLKITGTVVGINHPSCCFWVRVTAVKRLGQGVELGNVVRRMFTVIDSADSE